MLPAGNVIFVASQEAVDEAGPDFGETIEKVQENLSLEVMQELNARVDVDKEKPDDAAADYLRGVRLRRVAVAFARCPRGSGAPWAPRRSSTSTGPSSTPTTTTRSPGTGRFASTTSTPPVWRIHRHIGMGGDQLVAAVAGERGRARARRLDPRRREAPLRRADRRGAPVRGRAGADRRAQAARPRGRARELGARPRRSSTTSTCSTPASSPTAWTTSDDVERTKPAPDLVAVAMQRAGALSAVMVGDTTWDVEAAERAELKTIAVLTGGFSEAELLRRGRGRGVRVAARAARARSTTPRSR